MKSRMVPGLIAAVAAMAFIAEGRAETPSTPKPDRGSIEKIVRDYLVEHPEIIEEALKALRAKREIEQRQSDRDAIAANGDALRAHPMTPVSGNPAGDVTVVEFFDYQCGYCKRSLKPMMELLETDSKVRIVWKEYPILGPVSRFAARAAMAAGRQGRYYDFHVGVMSRRGQLTEAGVIGVAEKLGLNIEQLRRDMKDPAIEKYLQETVRLAKTLGIWGTPAFVIGDTLVPGAIDGARMKEIVAETRSGG